MESGPISIKRFKAQNFPALSNPQTKLGNIAHCKMNAIATKVIGIFGDNSYQFSLVELCKFLRFCTGSSYLPPPGYRDRLISVKFDRHAPGVATSTCINDIILPTCQAVAGSQEMFSSVMDAVQCDSGKPFNCL